jgi:methionyl-tRNA synthetase
MMAMTTRSKPDVPRFYLTTAIDYANGDPHLGHALEKIGADVIARYRRQCGDDVHLLIGMDEHGQKVQQTAAKEGVAPQAFTDTIALRFQAMWARLGISYDQFIRTTEPHHKTGVQALIRRIAERNPDDFYERSYTGMYCVGCEAFKQDADIVDGKCVLHTTRTLEEVEERNWFFRLSKYQGFLQNLLATNPSFIEPDSRRFWGCWHKGSTTSRRLARGWIGPCRSRWSSPTAKRRGRTCGLTRFPIISRQRASPTRATRSVGPPTCISSAKTLPVFTW